MIYRYGTGYRYVSKSFIISFATWPFHEFLCTVPNRGCLLLLQYQDTGSKNVAQKEITGMFFWNGENLLENNHIIMFLALPTVFIVLFVCLRISKPVRYRSDTQYRYFIVSILLGMTSDEMRWMHSGSTSSMLVSRCLNFILCFN
jgi:hypothetical protein